MGIFGESLKSKRVECFGRFPGMGFLRRFGPSNSMIPLGFREGAEGSCRREIVRLRRLKSRYVAELGLLIEGWPVGEIRQPVPNGGIRPLPTAFGR